VGMAMPSYEKLKPTRVVEIQWVNVVSGANTIKSLKQYAKWYRW
jgi:hypothetical protein